MKTIYTLLFIGLVSFSNAQVIYSEDFSGSLMPVGYALFNLDGLTPDDPDLVNLTDSAWTVKYISAQGFTGGYAAFSVSWYEGDEGPSDDWMVLPEVALGSDPYLSWTGMAITSSGDFRDQYQVFVSASGGDIEDYILLSPVFDTGNEGELDEPVTHEISLMDYAGETVRIAFRNWTQPYNPDLPTGPGNGGNELAIDDIIVSEGPVNVTELSAGVDIRTFPNPCDDDLNIYVGNQPGKVQVSVTGMTGETVLSGTYPVESGMVKVDVSEIATGTYTLLVSGDELVHSRQIVKR
jgi:hypothetical protein